MKILSLYFKNINSLEGESRIYFDREPIVDGGVFAITGPNGSGKSSVLDAITLGLYGETFRFDRPAEHVMTKETSESFSEVDFALGTDQYRASWHVKRQDGLIEGALLTPEMKLSHLNGPEQLLEESPQKVRDKMAELTGMDFHKFTKSMVLAQGDFAAFLNALDSERMDILEKISGSDIYVDYKEKAEEKYAQAQIRLQQLEQDLTATPVMDQLTREASEHDLADFKQQQSELKQDLDNVQDQLSWFKGFAELETQQERLSKQKRQAALQVSDNQQVLTQIDAVQDVAEYEEPLAELDSKSDAVLQSKNTLDSFRSEAASLQQQLKADNFIEDASESHLSPAEQKESIDKIKLKVSDLKFELPKETALLQTLNQQKSEKQAELAPLDSWLQAHVFDKDLLKSFPDIEELAAVRTELAELAGKQKSYSKWSKRTTASLANKKKEIESRHQKGADLERQIKQGAEALEAIGEGHSLDVLQEMQKEQEERVSNFLELNDLANVNEKLGNKGFFGQLFTPNISKEEQQLKEEIESTQLETGKQKNLIAVLEQAVINERLLKKMQDDRQHLIDGKPCPLCGALGHPYAEHAPAVSSSHKILAEEKKKLKGLLADEQKLAKQLIAVEQQAEKDEKKDSQLLIVRSQWNALANRLNVANAELEIENVSMMKDFLKEERKELSNLNGLVKRFAKQQQANIQAKETIETNSVVLKRLTSENESLNEEWEARPPESKDLEEAYEQIVNKEAGLADKVSAQLAQLNEKMPAKGKEAVLISGLNARKKDYQTYSERQNTLLAELDEINNKETECSSKIEQLNQGIQQCTESVRQEEMAGLHLSLVEKQKLIAEKEKHYAQQEGEISDLKNKLEESIKGTSANNLAELKKLVTLIKRQPEILLKQQELQQDISKFEAQLDSIEQQSQEIKHQQPEVAELELKSQQRNINTKLDIAKQESNSLQNKLSKQDSLKEKHDSIMDKLEDQKEEVKSAESDIQLIEDNNGVHFRRKVQNVMADKLLSKTNQVLEKISGRYYIRKGESEHGLALEIEDTKQHNVRRLPKTLSGGEGFVVSLALALGLAEMATNKYAVNSLFLDEGFGNLDAESLYLAMTTLESLKTHGKLVGVISHVEGVQKRIKTQIEMIKKPNGLSALKMVS